MSTKEEKPTLGGVRIRQRKRNINVPLDPVSFADAILDICKDAKESAPEGSSLEAILESATKGFAGADLDYNRYGDTFFEIIFTGWLMGSGSDDKGKSEDEDLGLYVLAAEATHDSILRDPRRPRKQSTWMTRRVRTTTIAARLRSSGIVHPRLRLPRVATPQNTKRLHRWRRHMLRRQSCA